MQGERPRVTASAQIVDRAALETTERPLVLAYSAGGARAESELNVISALASGTEAQ